MLRFLLKYHSSILPTFNKQGASALWLLLKKLGWMLQFYQNWAANKQRHQRVFLEDNIFLHYSQLALTKSLVKHCCTSWQANFTPCTKDKLALTNPTGPLECDRQRVYQIPFQFFLHFTNTYKCSLPDEYVRQIQGILGNAPSGVPG